MRMRNPRVVGVRRIMQRSTRIIPLNESRVRHSRIIQHKFAPHEPHQVDSSLWLAGEVVSLQLEARYEGGNCVVGFDGGRAIGCPARGETGADGGDLGGVKSKVRENGPGVTVSGVEGCSFVVAVEASVGVPEEGVGRRFDAIGTSLPVLYHGRVVQYGG